MRAPLLAGLFAAVSMLALGAEAATNTPHILQQPAISHDLVAFGYAGDLWVAPRTGGRATRLTTGVGIESAPVFSPDGSTIAFTGEYDGNTDVFTVPVTGGVPKRITFHPANDSAVAWSRDGKNIIFRSDRTAASRYTQLFSVPAEGGVAKALPLPMAYSGELSPDGKSIAYTPFAPAFGFNFTNYTAWGNYRGGRAGTIWITNLQTLDSIQVPHEVAGEASPVWADGKLYFLSGRGGPISVYRYDPATKAVSEVFHNTGPDIRSLSSDGHSLIFDRLGELYTLEPGGTPKLLQLDVAGDLPDVRPHIQPVGDDLRNLSVSPTGVRVAVEAHGEILTVPTDKKGGVRNLTNTPGVSEREPVWSPNGQSLAYFSDEDGLYELHVAAQTGARAEGPKAVRKFKLAAEPAYYFNPIWSPDSKKIAFIDNRLHTYLLDTETGKLSQIGEPDVYGGFTDQNHAMAWSPDSKWLAYPRYAQNHMHVLMLYSVAAGTTTQLTDGMADARFPAFDRNGKYLYFTASNHAGAAQFTLDMTSDLYNPTRAIYALALAGGTNSPTAPEADDEKSPAEAREKAKEGSDATPAGQAGEAKAAVKAQPAAATKPAEPKATVVDLAGLSALAIAERIAPLPLPERDYSELQAGKPGTLYFLESESSGRFGGGGGDTLSRYVLEDRKTEKLAEHVSSYELTADGEKMLVGLLPTPTPGEAPPPGGFRRPSYVVVSAKAPLKPGEGAVNFATLQVRVDPAAEWRQMYHEVWRIERAFFYDAGFHGLDTVAMEKKLEPYVASIQSRADLNYIFQEMLTGFSVGHLRGSGGAIPAPRRVPGGLLGADYEIKGGHYCISKIYTGGSWSPEVKAPLAQPGLHVHVGECILAIDGQPVSGDQDIQAPLEGTAGRAITLTLGGGAGPSREVTVIPVASEYGLRNLDWIDTNRRKVSELSGGKLAYVYLPDTGAGGFTAFNRYYFAQTDKQGVVVDERYNGGGQIADYIVEVLGRKIDSYWWARYGAPEHSPAAGIYGPKVMIANEVSGSGGDALPWLFKHAGLGPVVGKRTWGGLVGIGAIPVLMDGGNVTSPSVGFYSPKGEWDVENHGVDPDYPVEQDPKAVAAGHDPQLETAVSLAMSKLKDAVPQAPERPAFPNYHPAAKP
jgi:tricorn protease